MNFLTAASKESLCSGTHPLESQYMLEEERDVHSACCMFGAGNSPVKQLLPSAF